MKKLFFTSVIFLLSSLLYGQLPDTDIWLMDVTSVKDSIVLSNPVNLTNRKGYDSQPAFSPEGTYLLYTSIRDDNQSDIYKYDLKTKNITQVTKTKTSEYSPTFMPDGKNISVVMVEPDSTQRLWKFPINGGEPVCIMKNIDSIGYHCWINKDNVALIMITEPPTLETADVNSQKFKLITTNVSRCIQPRNDHKGFYYLKNNLGKDSTWKFSDNYKTIVSDVYLPSGSQDYYCFEAKKNTTVIAYGDKTFIKIISKNKAKVICKKDLSNFGITHITRLAISPNGKKLVFVAESNK